MPGTAKPTKVSTPRPMRRRSVGVRVGTNDDWITNSPPKPTSITTATPMAQAMFQARDFSWNLGGGGIGGRQPARPGPEGGR